MLLKKRTQKLLFSLAVLSLSQLAWSVPDSSDYKRDQTDEFVVDRFFFIKKVANKLLCVISELGTEALADKGLYSVIFDPSSCSFSRPGDTAGSFFESANKSYMRGVVSSQKTASGSYDVRAWIQYPNSDPHVVSHMGFEQRLYISANLQEPPSLANPLGVMRADFCLVPLANTGLCLEGGYIDSTQTSQKFYTYTTENFLPLTLTSLRMGEVDSKPFVGYGRAELGRYDVQRQRFVAGVSGDVQFDEQHIEMTDSHPGYSPLCYDRNVTRSPALFFDSRMGLYDVQTGERIKEEFADYVTYENDNIKYTGIFDTTGVWFPDVLTLPVAGKITILNKPGVFSLDVRRGFLSRRHVYVRPLFDTHGLDTYLWIDPSNVVDPKTGKRILPVTLPAGFYSMVWDSHKQSFALSYLDAALQKNTVEITLGDLSRMWLLSGWIPTSYGSNNLFTSFAVNDHHGHLLDAAHIQVEQNQLDLLYIDDPIFGSDQPLYCIHNCPTYDAIRAGTYFDPATTNPAGTAQSSVVEYKLKAGVLVDMSGRPMVIPQNAPLGSQFATGPLLTAAQLAKLDPKCDYPSGFQVRPAVGYCVSELNLVQGSFIWETGTEYWNHYIGLKDTAGHVRHVVDPKYFFYDVPEHSSSPLAGTSVLLRQSRNSVMSEPVLCLNLETNQNTTCTDPAADITLYNYYDIPVSETSEGQLRAEKTGVRVLYKPLRTGRMLANVPLARCVFPAHPAVVMPVLSEWHNPAKPPFFIGPWENPADYPVKVVDGDVL